VSVEQEGMVAKYNQIEIPLWVTFSSQHVYSQTTEAAIPRVASLLFLPCSRRQSLNDEAAQTTRIETQAGKDPQNV
jgi:hypothetical protein